MVEFAGLSDRVSVEIGSVVDRLPSIHRKYALSGPLDAVLLDHDASNYLADLQLLEKSGHISKGTVVLCDWSLYPGSDGAAQAPTTGEEFMDYLSEIGVNQSTRHSIRDKEIFTVSAGDWAQALVLINKSDLYSEEQGFVLLNLNNLRSIEFQNYGIVILQPIGTL